MMDPATLLETSNLTAHGKPDATSYRPPSLGDTPKGAFGSSFIGGGEFPYRGAIISSWILAGQESCPCAMAPGGLDLSLSVGNSGPEAALLPSPWVGELLTLVGVDVVPVVVAEWGSGDSFCLLSMGCWAVQVADLSSGIGGME